MAMASPNGLRSGATASSARYSTSPVSASAPPTNTGRRCRPTTIPRARWKRRANICKIPINGKRRKKALNQPSAPFSQEFNVCQCASVPALLSRVSDPLQDLLKPWIRAQRIEPRLPLAVNEKCGALSDGLVQQAECFLLFSQGYVDQSPIEGRDIALLGVLGELLQNLLGFPTFAGRGVGMAQRRQEEGVALGGLDCLL